MSYRNAQSIAKLIEDDAISINPYVSDFQGPNMYYCHLGQKVMIPKAGKLADTKNLEKDLYDTVMIAEYFDLGPGEFILAETFETFKTNTAHCIRLFNSSSLARLGVSQCAVGMINPGCGLDKPIRVTLELVNNGPFTIRLYPTLETSDKNGIASLGTEVLKVAVSDYEDTGTAYQDWSGNLYGTDTNVTGSKIDRRL